jgi:hypothetical protein
MLVGWLVGWFVSWLIDWYSLTRHVRRRAALYDTERWAQVLGATLHVIDTHIVALTSAIQLQGNSSSTITISARITRLLQRVLGDGDGMACTYPVGTKEVGVLTQFTHTHTHWCVMDGWMDIE